MKNVKASANMAGRAWSRKDRTITVYTIMKCVSIGSVVMAIIIQLIQDLKYVDISHNDMRWITYGLLQVSATFNPLLYTLMNKDINPFSRWFNNFVARLNR